jgi:hypothetical protein
MSNWIGDLMALHHYGMVQGDKGTGRLGDWGNN